MAAGGRVGKKELVEAFQRRRGSGRELGGSEEEATEDSEGS